LILKLIQLGTNTMKDSLIVFFFLVFSVQLAQANQVCPKSFDAAVSQQLTALDNRDLEAYMGAIPPRDDQLMILPDGNTWAARSEIARGHEEWFKDKSWVFKRELLRKDVRDTWGVVVYRAVVERPEQPGNPFLLSMMLAPEANGCWYLQHDQNTLLPRE
jgi:hypothetical protein